MKQMEITLTPFVGFAPSPFGLRPAANGDSAPGTRLSDDVDKVFTSTIALASTLQQEVFELL